MTDKIYLSKTKTVDTDSSITNLNNNVVVLGSSGCGKTTSIVEPTLLHANNSSYIVPITKRSLADKYIPVFKERGYKVYDLNFTNPKKSNIGFNPLTYLNNDRDFIKFADSFITTTMYSGDDNYWLTAATSVLAAIVSVVRKDRPKSTLAEVIEFANGIHIDYAKGSVYTNVDSFFFKAKNKDPNSIAARGWEQIIKNPLKTAENIYTMVMNNLDKIASDEILELSERKDSLDINRLGKEKSILFITTPPANKYTGQYLNIIYGFLFQQLFTLSQTYEDYKLPVPIQFVCDDFACGSIIPDFADHISYFRASGISVILLLQSESQLTSLYGENQSQTIINNCDTIVFMGGMDLDTCRRIAQRTNKPLDQILNLPLGDVIICRRGETPLFDIRYAIYKDKLWKKYNIKQQEKIDINELELEK